MCIKMKIVVISHFGFDSDPITNRGLMCLKYLLLKGHDV